MKYLNNFLAFVKKRTDLYIWIFLFINVLSSWKLMLVDTQLAYGDLSPFPESASQAWQHFIYVWKEISLGRYAQSGNMFGFIQFLFISIFRSALIAQKVYIFILPLISFISFRYFLKKHTKVKNDQIIFLASLFYSFSPIMTGQYLGGTHYSSILIFSLFPLLYSNTILFLQKFSIKRIYVLGIMLGILVSIYSHILLIYALSLIPLFLSDLIIRKLKAVSHWVNFLFVGIITFLFNPVIIFSSFKYVSTVTKSGNASAFQQSLEFFFKDVRHTYAKSYLTTVIKMGNNGGFFNYGQNNFWTIPFLILVVIVLIFSFYILYHPICESVD